MLGYYHVNKYIKHSMVNALEVLNMHYICWMSFVHLSLS